MQPCVKFTTCLWINGDIEQAARLYVSLFPGSAQLGKPEFGRDDLPSKLAVQICGREFSLHRRSPGHTEENAISFFIECDDQKALDRLWDALVAHGGQAHGFGKLIDRFGVAWQIVPKDLARLLTPVGNAAANERVWDAFMSMTKIDAPTLERLARGE